MTATTADLWQSLRNKYLWIAVVVSLALLRVCHLNLLWADEDYHMAAALNVLQGRLPYRDFWYDKPPLCAAYYLLVGGFAGLPVRLLDAAYVLVSSLLAYRVARTWWGEAEARTASLLLAFSLAFYLPSAVIPFAADALMILPHLAAIYYARLNRALLAGVWGGIAFLFNAKGLFVLAVCVLWLMPQWWSVVIGFALPVLAGLITAFVTGTWAGYYEQVWHWSLIYAEESPVINPFALGLRRTADWLGFQGALTAGAIYGFFRFTRDERRKFAIWTVISFVGVCLGTRFEPRYFLQLLPPMAVLAARGITLALARFRKTAVIALALLLLVPVIRFGPRYVLLAIDDMHGKEPHWIDIALDLDSRRVAARLNGIKTPGDTLFVWGYRPDIYAYTRLIADGRFWDSQPLTGVPADRHLKVAKAVYGGAAAANRQELAGSHPTFVIDGLSLLNPALAPALYPELRPWLARYRLVGRTELSLIYRRID